MKKYLFFVSSLLLVFCLLLFPSRTFFHACAGVNLWFHTVLPSLLPFLILTSLLIQANSIHKIPDFLEHAIQTVFGLSACGFSALFLGLLCGFPMGARITAQLYEAGKIDRNEACYLLTFCSSPSPAFLLSYLAGNIFFCHIRPVLLFTVLYAADFASGLLFRFYFGRFRFSGFRSYKSSDKNPDADSDRNSGKTSYETFYENEVQEKKEMPKQTSKGNLLDTSIMNGFEIITQLGGYIILFSILSGLLMDLHPFGPATPFFCGILEITTGVSQLASSSFSFPQKASAILFATAFGGISVAAQTNCMIRKSGLPLWPYLAGKLCCAIFAGTLSLFLFAFLF